MMPLTMVTEGKTVKINEIKCGQVLKKRLSELGLYENTSIKVIKNSVSGPLVINLKDSKFVLGRGQANKILVET